MVTDPATLNIDPNEIERAIRVNLESPILLAHALMPGMTERGTGHLVFVSSIAGKTAASLWQNALLEQREIASVDLTHRVRPTTSIPETRSATTAQLSTDRDVRLSVT